MAFPRISVFPKGEFDALCDGRKDLIEWLHEAATLGGEGVEHYDGFFRGPDPALVTEAKRVLAATGQVTSLICFSPDFTHPDPAERARQVERQRRAIDLAVEMGTTFCRTLSGQRHPSVSRSDGVRWAVEGIERSLEYAAKRGVTLCLENHYKDGSWKHPEFAQAEDVFLEILDRVDAPNFGVQYDPSNAVVGGYDPVAFLEKVKHRVVSMHASDRYLAEGATLDAIRNADGTVGYPDQLRHGVTGQGLNDYDAIFRILASVGFDGWISVEDGVDSLDQQRQSVEFLKRKRAEYFGGSGGQSPA